MNFFYKGEPVKFLTQSSIDRIGSGLRLGLIASACFFAILSTAHAQNRNGRAYPIKKPRLPFSNSAFNADSDATGVCKSMGFTKAAGSSLKKEYASNKAETIVTVDAEGNISKSTSELYYTDIITEILCDGYLGNGLPQASFLLEKPAHPQSQAKFSGESDENGICIALGYHGAAKGSMKTGSYSEGLFVGADGYIQGYKSGSVVEKIICLLTNRRQ